MRREILFFLMGLVLAAAMAPAAVVAAVQLVRIKGPSGKIAEVDAANQLLTAESDPAAYRWSYSAITATNSCKVLQTPLSNKAFIVKQLRVEVHGISGTMYFSLYQGTSCGGTAILTHPMDGIGSFTETFEPGIPLNKNTGLSAIWTGASVLSQVRVYGYTVPPAAVP